MALNTQLKNYSAQSRGKIVGLLACFFGLCSGIFTQLYKAFFTVAGDNNSGRIGDFLLFLCIVVSAVSLIGTLGSAILPNPAGADPPPAEPKRLLAGRE